MKNLLGLEDLKQGDLQAILELAETPVESLDPVLSGKGVACFFQKPSSRTRNSTEMAVVNLGGHPIYITNAELGIGERESVADVARTLASYHAGICARVFDHSLLEEMAAAVDIPVVNLLSDQSHPLQAIADVITIKQEFGVVEGKTVCYVGDANNVARSLGLAVCGLGGRFHISSPAGYSLQPAVIDLFENYGAEFDSYESPMEAVACADVVYTDTWTSMGQESERKKRLSSFFGFQVDDALMSAANPNAIFMHCLPAHRGEEVSNSVIESNQSRVWQQAKSRLSAARGALAWLHRKE